jgi:SAM-dependent methyltransferase
LVLRRTIPATASVVKKMKGDRLHSPAAAKNVSHITELVCSVSPKNGAALEIASGTGQHIIKLAAAIPNLTWQPSDIDIARLNSIVSWSFEKQLPNLLPPIKLDVTYEGWSALCPDQDFVLLVNLLHLVSESEAIVIIGEISQSLTPGGRCVIYGPFMRDGFLTSDGDKFFHQSLIEADPDIGYKNDTWMLDLFQSHNLKTVKIANMPSNNLAFIIEKNHPKRL